MHRLAAAVGRRPGAMLLELSYVIVAVVIHSATAIALAAGLLALSAVRRGMGRRLATTPSSRGARRRPAVIEPVIGTAGS